MHLKLFFSNKSQEISQEKQAYFDRLQRKGDVYLKNPKEMYEVDLLLYYRQEDY